MFSSINIHRSRASNIITYDQESLSDIHRILMENSILANDYDKKIDINWTDSPNAVTIKKLDKSQRDLVAYHEDFLQDYEDGVTKKWLKGQVVADIVSDLLGVIDELSEK